MTNSKPSFFFYDLETSGIDPRRQRIMQFAGQRTDMQLNVIGEPINLYVALSEEVLPEPEAVMITGITPQKTLEDGYSEAEFCKILNRDVFTPDTIIVGFNNVRFDDEFLRYTLYRNFYDPYSWAWAEGRSRWDILDVARLTRALRPQGINWPVDEKGKTTNRLELLTKANNLDHENAHDAMNDVLALISVTKLIKEKQPKLFDFMLQNRSKKAVETLVNLKSPRAFVYTSGRFNSTFEKTTICYPLAPGLKPGSVIVYDLRYDPTLFAKATPKAMAAALFASYEERKADGFTTLPVKELSYNRCPAIAPLSVLDDKSEARINLSKVDAEANLIKLLENTNFTTNVRQAYEQREAYPEHQDVDAQLYDGFIAESDKDKLNDVNSADRSTLKGLEPKFKDKRLPELLVRYKARNYPSSLNQDDREAWEAYKKSRLGRDMPAFSSSLRRLASSVKTNEGKQFLLSELQLWLESVMPSDEHV